LRIWIRLRGISDSNRKRRLGMGYGNLQNGMDGFITCNIYERNNMRQSRGRLKDKVLIWGTGLDYGRFLNQLKALELQEVLEVVGVTDSSGFRERVTKVDGWHFYSVSEIKEIPWDYCVVMSEKYFWDIYSHLAELGISSDRIIPCRVFAIPYFEWVQYIEIRNLKMSIISNNCWGGILSRTLGLEHRSPFKNLAVSASGLIRMLDEGLEGFMSVEPKFVRWEIDPHSKVRFPVMSVKGVEILFNHDTKIEEALAKWRRRKEKIDYHNLYMMIYTEDIDVVRAFLKLDIERKICFVPDNIITEELKDESTVFPICWRNNQDEFWLPVNESAKLSGLNYKILPMILGKKEKRLEIVQTDQ